MYWQKAMRTDGMFWTGGAVWPGNKINWTKAAHRTVHFGLLQMNE